MMVAWEYIQKAKSGLAILLLVVLLTVGISNTGSASGPKKTEPDRPVPLRLFGTIEFRSSLKALPQWVRVLSVIEQQMGDYTNCIGDACSPAAKSWQQMIRLARSKSPMETLKTVNAFFNKWPYRLDIEIYGVSDYWASPNEFLKMSGDCEDFSIAKYFALKQLGFNTETMRIVVVRDKIRNIGHAVLAVYMDDTAFILDNLSNLILPHSRYQHYVPQYSVNGANRWAHIRLIGRQGF